MAGRTQKWSIITLIIAAFVAGIFFAAGVNVFNKQSPLATGTYAQQAPQSLQSDAIELAEKVSEAFSEVAEAVNPSVVQILSARVVRSAPIPDMFKGTPFEQFFGQGPQREQLARGLGSGVIIRSDGYIVTNYHVVRDADELEVRLMDGSDYEAEVIGTDPAADLAVIKIDAEDLPALLFGDASKIRVGQFVLAFGSPLSEYLGNTVTSGIISAIKRRGLSFGAPFEYFIQTDAAINPGNSGGPLVNLRGEIVGINTAIATRTGGYQGIGFAIPADIAQNVVEQLIEKGKVSRGYLGVRYRPITESLARALKVSPGAAEVVSVEEDSPADKAGLKEGDIIVAVDGKTLKTADDLAILIANRKPGEKVTLEILRDGKRKTVEVTLGERPDTLAARVEEGKLELKELGLTLANLTPELRQRFGIQDESVEGIAVVEVDPKSEAYKDADIRVGDIIVEVDKQPVRTVSDFKKIYEKVKPGDSFILRIRRGQITFLTALTKPQE